MTTQISKRHITPIQLVWGGGGVFGIVILSIALSWASSRFTDVKGWPSFLGVLLICCGAVAGTWWLLRRESLPRWLLGLVIGAALLRLVLGAVWFIVLPTGGYNSPAERAGYVMADAYNRDRGAWDLGHSDRPLWRAFQSYRKVDQYGGMLFFSALVYRLLGSADHQPLLIVVISAFISSLAVVYTWAFTRRAWGDATARLAAWGLAFYPEAVLLGSSQMREAFIIPAVAAAFYGVLVYWKERNWRSLAWIVAPLLVCLFITPPVAIFVMFLLGIQVLMMGWQRIIHHRYAWIILGGLVLLAVAGSWLTLKRLAPGAASNPVHLLVWFMQKTAEQQGHITKELSGWIQKIFRSVPRWAQLPLLLGYGFVVPFLPAALFDMTGFPIWRVIGIWRAIGWNLLLVFLIYAPLRVFEPHKNGRSMGEKFARGLVVVVWLGILVASLRAGADMWDNPRYRAMFAALQVALAAWIWVDYRKRSDARLRHFVISLALAVVWLFPWYLRRYINFAWPVQDFFLSLGLGLASAAIYLIWVWLRKKDK